MRSMKPMSLQELRVLVNGLPTVKEVPLDYVFDGQLRNATGHKALVNAKTGYLEAVVSEKYAVVQHREVFSSLVDSLEQINPDAKIRASVLLDKGRAWMSVVFSEMKADDGAQGIELGFTAMNSYDKSSSVHFAGTQKKQEGHFEFFGLRLACMNGMTLKVKIDDWNNIDVRNAAEARVGDIVGVEKAFVGETRLEAASELSFRHIGRVNKKLCGVAGMVVMLPRAATALSARIRAMREERVDFLEAHNKLKEMGFGSRTADKILDCFGNEEATAWGLTQAITHRATYGERVSPRRMQEILAMARVEV